MHLRWHTGKQHTVQRHNFFALRRLGALLLIALLAAACGRGRPTPTATPPAATPTMEIVIPESSTPESAPSTPTFEAHVPTPQSGDAAAADSPPGIASGNVSEGAIFTSPRYSYTIVLPCCWLALPTPGTAFESALAELEAENEMPLWGDLGERVRERESGAVLELIALLPDEENVALPAAQVTVSVLPTYGLTLDSYLAATADELNSIANTAVLTALIEPSLGVGGFPASLIEYTATPAASASDQTSDQISDQTMAGLQVAFFGHDAETLIVVTFTTTVERFEQLQPEFLHIVRTMTLHDSTA